MNKNTVDIQRYYFLARAYNYKSVFLAVVIQRKQIRYIRALKSNNRLFTF